MDWLEQIIQKLTVKLKMQSLKRALVIYIMFALIFTIMVYIATLKFCDGWINIISQKYNVTNIHLAYPNKFDLGLINIIDIIEKSSVLLYIIIAISITSHLFYKNRLQAPISILNEEAKYISRDDLGYECTYNSGDEMGEICEAFNKMRLQLYMNKQNQWNIMADQRELNAAFAHDLRTPLTVMLGYTELLKKYYPQGKISEEKLIDTIGLIEAQVIRLKNFSESMKGINTLEALEVKRSKNKVSNTVKRFEEIINGVKQIHNIEIKLQNDLEIDEAYYDEHIILEVFENLLSNAVSYAKKEIDVILIMEEDRLCVYIRDDGQGFSKEELFKAEKPYYSSRKDSEGHFGLGLAISKMLCQKHGGSLVLSNSTRGGAIVCASFFIM